jgi:cation-transporting ATPase E
MKGRRVINNISRASSMYLVKTVFSMLLSIYVICLVREYPFLPVHLSVISAFGVGMPTFFLQLEPSFEKVSGNFFSNALRKSVPSALAVFITAILCMLIRDGFYLPDQRFYGIFVSSYMLYLSLYAVPGVLSADQAPLGCHGGDGRLHGCLICLCPETGRCVLFVD